jgi:hypothetical protein
MKSTGWWNWTMRHDAWRRTTLNWWGTGSLTANSYESRASARAVRVCVCVSNKAFLKPAFTQTITLPGALERCGVNFATRWGPTGRYPPTARSATAFGRRVHLRRRHVPELAVCQGGPTSTRSPLGYPCEVR